MSAAHNDRDSAYKPGAENLGGQGGVSPPTFDKGGLSPPKIGGYHEEH